MKSIFLYITRRFFFMIFLSLTYLIVFSSPACASSSLVSVESANVYSGPGTSYELVGILACNTRVEILESSSGWCHIEAGNVNGWLAENMLNQLSDTSSQTLNSNIPSWIKPISGAVNLRQGAGTSFKQVGTLVPGTVLEVLGKQDKWYQVRMSNGSTAYIASWLVTAAVAPASSKNVASATAGGQTLDVVSASPPITVSVNGKTLLFDVKPIINNGRTLVPLRAIFEALGASVTWDENTQSVSAQNGNTVVVLKVGSFSAVVNGQEARLDVPAIIVANRTLVPLRFVGEALGGRVAWDESQRQINIFSPPHAGDKLAAVLIEGNNVYLRSTPSTTADILASVSKGMQFSINSEENGWFQITYLGKTGWVAGWLVKPVWKSELSSSSLSNHPTEIAQDKQVIVNYSKEADGLHLTMQGTTKLPAKISEAAGTITYSFSNWHLAKECNINEQIGSGVLSITGYNQDSGAIVKATLPTNLIYQKSIEDNGSKQCLFIPNCITAVDRTTFDSSGERLDITTLTEATPTIQQNDNTMVITLPGVAQGFAQSAYSYPSKSIKSFTITQQPSGAGYNTLITIQTTDAAKFSVGSGGSNGQVHIMFILKKDIPDRDSLVVIDPGHGGKDSGALGSFSKEKDINLAVALKVGTMLTRKGINVAYTRTTDVFVPLESESATANIMNAALFVSIHCNSAQDNPDAQGTETYYYAPDSNPELYLQKDERENLARAIHQRLVTNIGRPDRGVKTYNLSVLRNTDMPSALVELAFICNLQEETLLNQEEFQNKAAQAIAEGIAACMPTD